MRVSSALLVALPALALAEDQVPLVDKVKGWFNQAQSYVSTAIPAAATPVEAAASKIAETAVANLTLENWRQTINSSASASAAGPQEWMIYVTGGNKTCFGLCGNTTAAWNVCCEASNPEARANLTRRNPSLSSPPRPVRPTSPSLTARLRTSSATAGRPVPLQLSTSRSLLLSPTSRRLLPLCALSLSTASTPLL